MTQQRFGAVVIGTGPAGEVAVSRLSDQGLNVALVERELIGGECAYWACIPSKTLLRPPETRAEARRAAGAEEPALDGPRLAEYRIIRHLDDSRQVAGYERHGVTVIKGEARIVGRGRIAAADIAGTPSRRTTRRSRALCSPSARSPPSDSRRRRHERGVDVVTSRVSLADGIARPSTYETNPRATSGSSPTAGARFSSARGPSRRSPASGFTKRPRDQDAHPTRRPSGHGRAVPHVQRGVSRGRRGTRRLSQVISSRGEPSGGSVARPPL
jgi:hypothetical protein